MRLESKPIQIRFRLAPLDQDGAAAQIPDNTSADNMPCAIFNTVPGTIIRETSCMWTLDKVSDCQTLRPWWRPSQHALSSAVNEV
jgi:hypothetical protein